MSAKGAKRPNRSARRIATNRSKKRSSGSSTPARSKMRSVSVATRVRPEAARGRAAKTPLANALGIKFGLRLPSFALGARTATLAQMGAYLRRAEDLGFDSAVSIDHLLLTPPAYACTWLEPVALLSALAGVTRTIKLGTMVLVLPLRNPAYFAKEWATLDLLSGGRSILGVGVGWHEEEFALMGVPHKERGRRMDEMLEAVTALWAGERVTYDGQYYKFRDLTIDPKPLQKPHPPIIVGGDGATTFDRVVEFGDGWMPINRPNKNPVGRIPELRHRLEKAGRDPKSVPVSVFYAPPDRSALEALASAGVERAIFPLPSEPRDAVLPHLDAYAAVMK
jgi:probable F420-dependent oxidoreductase